MIEITIGDLVGSTEILQKLSNMSLKARLAWQVAKILKLADKEIQEFNETRMNVIKKYGKKDENGELITDEKGNCTIPPENNGAFNTELNELLQAKVTLNANPLTFDELENLNFTPAEITRLEPFIEVDEDE